VVLVIALIGLLSAIAHPTAGDRPIESGAVTLFGVVYVGVPLGFAVLLRAAGAEPWLGAILAIFPIAVSWAGDSAAYFGGRRWGRAKLAPHVSPGKTVAGSVCGVVGSIAMGLLIVFLTGLWIPGFPVDYLGAVVLSVAIAVIAQAGDLAESALKRSSGLKDSGSFLPGHGGVLDRFDGVLVALPVTYLVLSTLEMIG
jgi:phosphatidate cytidylyltransferase